jgi:F-box protein 9
MSSSNELTSELESFRQQWLSDLQSKNTSWGPPPSSRQAGSSVAARFKRPSGGADGPKSGAGPSNVRHDEEDDHYLHPVSFDDPANAAISAAPSEGASNTLTGKDLVSALDHFEEAVEKEAQGNLGESLRLYRIAFRVGCPIIIIIIIIIITFLRLEVAC